jgi:hypothetical protein
MSIKIIIYEKMKAFLTPLDIAIFGSCADCSVAIASERFHWFRPPTSFVPVDVRAAA